MSIDPNTALTQIVQLAQAGLSFVPPPPPPPPVPPLDLQTWWIPKTGKFTRPCFARLLPDGRVAAHYVKNVAGWPMDINIVDSNGVSFAVTENDDPSGIGWPGKGVPTAYRRYLDGGFKISPRYYDPNQGRILVTDATSVNGEKHSDCATFTLTHLGPARSYISLVPQMALGGQLGAQDVLVCEYYYTKLAGAPEGFRTAEHFILTQDSGWVGWELRQWDGKAYSVTKTSVHNAFIPDTTQVPVFPCNVAF